MVILLLLSGALILFIVQRAVYEKFWDKGLSLRVRFDSASAFEGESRTLTEVVENRSYLPLPFVHAKFELHAGLVFDEKENLSTSDLNYKNDIFSVLFYQRVTRKLSYSCRKRGFYHVDRADLTSSDLFYQNHMVATFPQSTAFYVYPKPVDVSRFSEPLRKLIGETAKRSYLYPDPFEFRGLRNYTVSDPMNTINWKASAKQNELMVNMFDSTISKKMVILLNLEDETLIRHEELHEESIRIAASVAASLLSDGYPVTLITNGRDLESKEKIDAFAAGGLSQTDTLYRALSRIDLNLQPEEFYPLVDAVRQDPDYTKAGYILISASMKAPLQASFTTLTRDVPGLYVTPLYKNMTSHVTLSSDAEVLRWEVDGYA